MRDAVLTFTSAGLALAYAAGLAVAQPSFHRLGLLPGGLYNKATGFITDGSVVVGWASTATRTHPVYWTAAAGLVVIPDPPSGVLGGAVAVSADGTVVVGNGTNPGGFSSGYRWSGSGIDWLPQLPPGWASGSGAAACSADGSVVVGTSYSGAGVTSVRWVGTTPQDLGALPGGTGSEATGVSGDGSVVVGYSTSSEGTRAYRWTAAGGMVSLGVVPGDDYSYARAVSADGGTVVGFSEDHSQNDAVQAFCWSKSTGMLPLGTLPNTTNSEAFAVSGDGTVVVGRAGGMPAGSPAGSVAFRWTAATGIQDLQSLLGSAVPPGWLLTGAYAVSADGTTIAGLANGPCGSSQAWIARLDGPTVAPPCYANCDGSLCPPILTSNDFQCFLNKYAGNDTYANCDGSTGSPTLTANDFQCFLNAFAAGCQ